jgi:dihydrolipoamide dehydrogenase
MPEERIELLVIGGGPGGYAAAFHAADLGKQVTIVDPEPMLGGSCLLRGCIPSKALITAAELAEQIRGAGAVGIETGPVAVRMERLSQWRQNIIRQMGKGLGELARRRNVRWIRGRARFLDDRHVAITSDSGDATLAFDHAIIATGAEPAFPAGLEPDGRLVLDSTAALELDRVPARLLVVGGGYIGLELGSCFRLLGSAVTIVELTGGLLPGTDTELVRPVARKLESRSVRVLLESCVLSIDRAAEYVDVTIRQSAGATTLNDRFDCVLVCVGRSPNTGRLDLARAGVETDSRGFITCDTQGRTSRPEIFAIGDCSGGPLLAHKARRDGIVAAEVICGRAVSRDQKTVPAVIFSDPEIAYCGLSEPDAIAAGRDIKIGWFPFVALGRALTQRSADGMVKLIADAATEQVLGVGIVGPSASELIAEATLAVELGATVEDLMHTIHAHPTLAEALPEAAELVRGASIHIYKKSRA